MDSEVLSTNKIQAIYPANSLQQGFIFHAVSQPHDDAYLVQSLCDYHQALDIHAYEKAWGFAVNTYPALRLCFNWDESPIQIITKQGKCGFIFQDISHLPDKNGAILQLQQEDRRKNFDLTNPSLLRIYLIKQSDHHYTLLKTEHHSIADAWSAAILLNQVHSFYEAFLAGTIPIIQEDIAYLQAQNFITKHQTEAQSYWRKTIQTISEANDINMLLTTQTNQESFNNVIDPCEITLEIESQQYERLKKLAHDEAITLHGIFQFAWHKILQTYTGDSETIVGTVVSGRTLPIIAIEKSVGLYINTLPLLINWDNHFSVKEQLQHIHQTITGLNKYSFVNLSSLQKKGNRLFNSLLLFENFSFPQEKVTSPKNIEAANRRSIQKLNYPLALTLHVKKNTLSINFKYDATYLSTERANLLLAQLVSILKQIPCQLHQSHHTIDLLTADEKQKILFDWNKTDCDYPKDKTLQDMFESQVLKTPNATALVFEETQLTYAALNTKANQLAHFLHENGLKPGELVALCHDRSLELIIAILAILKAGCAYVPIDPEYPIERILYVLKDTESRFLLTQNTHRQHLDGIIPKSISCIIMEEEPYQHTSSEKLNIQRTSRDLAYVIYTSGTTGNPKGVAITHSGAVNRIHWMQNTYPLTENDAVLQKTPYSFDVSVWELLWANWTGAKIVLARPNGHKDPQYLQTLIEKENITVLHFVPSMLSAFTETLASFKMRTPKTLRFVFCSGEALYANQVSAFYDLSHPNVLIHNLYGPTEASIDVTAFACERGIEKVYIGRPIQNTRVYILTAQHKPVPVGAIGELYLGGAGLAREYWHQPTLTEKSFIHNSFATKEDLASGYTRLYKTGDRVRWTHDGNIEYLGRNDSQVKIRGFRIELSEIEQTMLAYSGVQQAVAIVKEQATTEHTHRFIAAYYVGNVSEKTLRSYLSKNLPEHMLPAFLMAIAAFPMTSNGKLNRKALPAPVFKNNSTDEGINPRNTLEKTLSSIWQKVLKVTAVKITDNFFDLGGDSIRSIQLISKMQAIGFHTSVNHLFKYKTILGLLENNHETIDSSENNYFPFSLINAKSIDHLLKNNAALEDIYPASHLQMGMLVDSQKSLNEGTYHDIFIYTINHSFDQTLFLSLFHTLSEKYPLLRTAFLEDQEYGYLCLQYEKININDHFEGMVEDTLKAFIQKEKNRAFEFKNPGLFSLFILNKQADKFSFAFSFHHAMADGWSIASLITEFTLAYTRNRFIVPQETIPPYQIVIQKERFALSDKGHDQFWKTYLTNAPFPASNFVFYPKAIENNTMEKQSIISDQQMVQLLSATKRLNVSADIIFLAAYCKTLSRFSGENDLVIGLVINNRLTQAGGDKVFGMHLNTLPLRIAVNENSESLAKKLAHQKEDIESFKAFPYGKIRTSIGNGNDIYTCAFNYMHFHITENVINTNTLNPAAFFEKTTIPLTLHISRHHDHFKMTIKALTGFIDAITAEEMLAYLAHDLHAVVHDLEFTWISKTDEKRLKNNGNSHTIKNFPQKEKKSSPKKEPQTTLEKALCSLWENILSTTKIGIEDNFFELGGDSILSIRLIAKMQSIGFYVSVNDLFKYKTISQLIQNVNQKNMPSKEVYTAFSLIDEATKTILRSKNETIEDIYPASYLQIGMIVESQKLGSNGTYHDIFSYTIHMHFNQEALLTLFDSLCKKYPLLRTAFSKHVEYGYICIQHKDIDIQSHFGGIIEDSVTDFIDKEKNNPIALEQPGLFHLFVLNPSKDEFTLVFSFHHAITDGWSVTSLISEFISTYTEKKTLTSENIPLYQNVIQQERIALTSNAYELFWRNHLKNAPYPAKNLIFHPSHLINEMLEIGFTFNAKKTTALLNTAKQLQVSPDILFLSAYFKTLSRFMNNKDVIIGLVMNNRLEETGGDKVFGLHLNTLPLRAYVDHESSTALADYLSKLKIEIDAYKTYPYGKIRSDITEGRDIYTFAFNYMHFHNINRKKSAKKISKMQFFEKTTIPFTLHVARYENKFTLTIKTLSGFIDKKSADIFLDYLQHDLNSLIAYKSFSFLSIDHSVFFKSHTINLVIPEKIEKMTGYLAPKNVIEKELCEIWQSILHIPKIGITDSFFELGGDSIRSIRLIAKMQEIGFSVSVNDIFKHKTILALIENYQNPIALKKNSYIAFSLIDETTKTALLSTNKPGSIEDSYPASYLQMGMLISSLKAEANGTYHDVFSYAIKKPFHEASLITIFKTLCQKHPLLRTAFFEHADYGYIAAQYTSIDFNSRYGGVIECNLSDFINSEKIRNLPHNEPGLFSLFILNVRPEAFILAFSFHHAITDGWSVASLISEFVAAYSDQHVITVDQIPLYQQMIEKERLSIASESHKKFWQDYLINAPLPVQNLRLHNALNTEKNLSDHPLSTFSLDSEYSKNILISAKKLNVSTDAVFLSAYFKTLSRLTNQNDLIIGIVMNNRLEVEGGDKVFGLHLNTLPLRVHVINNSEQLTINTSDQKIEIEAYKTYPYGKIRSEIAKNNELYTCAFNYIHFHVADKAINSGVLNPIAIFEKTTIPLTLQILRHNDQFSVSIKSLNDFIDHETTVKFLKYIKHDLDAIINSHEFSWITESDAYYFENKEINWLNPLKMEKKSLYKPPRNTLEKRLCEIWQTILKIDTIGINDNFFELGGDSIQSIRLIAEMQKINFHVSVNDIFKYKTISELIENTNYKMISKEETYTPYMLIENDKKSFLFNKYKKESIEDIYPASQLQNHMISASLKSNADGVYHDVFSYKIHTTFNENLLLSLFQQLIEKYPVLRTAFVKDRENNYFCVQYAHSDIKDHYKGVAKESIFEFTHLEKKTMIPLENPGLFRVFSSNIKHNEFTLIISFHHAIADGWSIASLLSEFTNSYFGKKSVLIEKIPAFQKVIQKENRAIKSDMHKTFWHNYLSDYHPSKKPIANTENTTQIESGFLLSHQKSQLIFSTAKRLGVSVDMILLAYYVKTLSTYFNESDLSVGLVTNNRLEENGGDKVFGLHLNILPLRVKNATININHLDDFILSIDQERLSIVSHKAYPYSKLCLDLNNPTGFYSCAFNYTHFHVGEDNQKEKMITPIYAFEKMAIPLMLQVSRYHDELKLIIRASSEFIDETSTKQLLTRLEETIH